MQLRIVLVINIVLSIASCSYKYAQLRIAKVVAVPYGGSDTIRADVYYSAYVVYINKASDYALCNNNALDKLKEGKMYEALHLLQSISFHEEPAILNNYGVALVITGETTKGLEYIAKAAQLQPNNQYFRKNFLYLHELAK